MSSATCSCTSLKSQASFSTLQTTQSTSTQSTTATLLSSIPFISNKAKNVSVATKPYAKKYHKNSNADYAPYFILENGHTAKSAGPLEFVGHRGAEKAITEEKAEYIDTEAKGRKANKMWDTVKRYAKEHHEATNMAFNGYYGGVMGLSVSGISSRDKGKDHLKGVQKQ
jgi:hypothetical protein